MLRRTAVAVLLVTLACSDSPSDPGGDPDPVDVASVTVSVGALDLVPGQSETVTATPRDASGGAISGVSPTWSSSAGSVATVTASGAVTAVAAGTATLTASAGGRSATVNVVVGDGGVVGAAGGTVTALGGLLRLEIPQGALSSTATIRISAVSSPPGGDRLVAATAVRITPESLAFGAGTRLSLVYPAELAGAVVEHRIRLGRLEGAGWTDLDVLPVDVPARRAEGAIGTGGTYAVLVPPLTMRDAARARGVDFGAALSRDALANDAAYRDLLASEYTSITPENVMKFGPIHPAPNTYDFQGADDAVEFAETWGMAVHGHVLLWHSQQPAWVMAGSQTRTSLLADLKDHIETVVGRYAGRIASWDVANEVIADDGTGLRPTFWTETVGADVIDSAFVWAHRADPEARLYLNDYSVAAIGAKSDSLLALATRLRDAGIPVHGIGLQGHILHTWPAPSAFKPNVDRIAAAGFDVRYTEVDVRLPDGQDLLAEQADQYRNVAEACLAQPRCTALTTWGATDRYSWIPGWFSGFGRALPFDEFYLPKPAYHAIREAFEGA